MAKFKNILQNFENFENKLKKYLHKYSRKFQTHILDLNIFCNQMKT